MCINPRRLPTGHLVPCHQCWQCHENRINDWVGRCIAEKETSLAASFVTLTYGGGDCAEARFLRKSDVTAYLKAIRNDGHKVRFFCTGEYGSSKGRSHWHVLLFWQTPMPFRPIGQEKYMDPWWPHGFSMWDEANEPSIRYCVKYVSKDLGDAHAQQMMGMSKKPILGWGFFYELAGRYVASGLSPQRPFYKFRDVLNKEGRPLEFYMPPLVAEHFCGMFMQQWREANPGRHWPTSDMVDNYHDKLSGYHAPFVRTVRKFGAAPWMLPPDGSEPRFDEKLNSFYADIGGERLYWSYDKGGHRTWQREIVTETEAERRRAVCEARKLSGR